MRVKRSKLFQSLVFHCNKIQQLLTKSIKIKPPRLPPLLLCSFADFESPPGPFWKQLWNCWAGSCTGGELAAPSIPSHHAPSIPLHRVSKGGDKGSDMGRCATAQSQRTGLIRAQLGSPARREGPCATRHLASSDWRCPWLWLPPAVRPEDRDPSASLLHPLGEAPHQGPQPLTVAASRSGARGYL